MKACTSIAVIGTLAMIFSVRVFCQDVSSSSPEDWTAQDIPVLEGDEISIVETRETNQRVQVVTREDIDRSGAQDVVGLLASELNCNITRNGAYGNLSSISLRGFGGGRVAVLIDGVPVNSAQSGDFDLGKINLASVEKIEVIYGGSDTQYNFNGAVGGVVNIITMKKATSGFSFSGGFSNLSRYPGLDSRGELRFATGLPDLADTQNANVTLSLGKPGKSWKLSLNGNRAANNFMFMDERGDLRSHVGNGVWDGSLSTAFSSAISETMRIMVSGEGYYGKKNITGPAGSMTAGREVDLFTKESIFLDADALGGKNIDTELVGSHGYNSIDWTDPAGKSLHSLNAITLINRWNWFVSDWLVLNPGGDLEYSMLDSSIIGVKKSLEGGAYLTAHFSLGSRFEIVSSLKGVLANGFIMPVPKLGLVWRSSPGLTLKNNYFRTFKLPTFNDRYWPADSFAEGNPDLKPEDGIGSDLIVDLDLGNLGSLETSMYGSYQQEAILWQPASGKWRPENVGEALYAGVDATVKSGFSDRLKITGRYSFLLSYVLSGDLTVKSDRRMPYRPVHSASLGLEYYWKSGMAGLSGHFESERFVTTQNVSRLEPFFTADLILNQEINSVFSFFVSVKNAFNASYSTIAGYPLPGGSITSGLKILYDSK